MGKGLHRETEKVALEQPVGVLATKDMPKCKGSALDKAQFKEAFTKWMRTSMHAKERDREKSNKGVELEKSLIQLPGTPCWTAQVRVREKYEKLDTATA